MQYGIYMLPIDFAQIEIYIPKKEVGFIISIADMNPASFFMNHKLMNHKHQ